MSRSTPVRITRALLVTFAVLVLSFVGTGTASAAGLTISGPSEVVQSGVHTYRADLHAFYQNYTWYTRFCGTTSLSCTSTWSWTRSARVETGPDTYSRSLNRDCTGSGTKSFQIMVTANGFNTPTETAYKVTKLCGSGPA